MIENLISIKKTQNLFFFLYLKNNSHIIYRDLKPENIMVDKDGIMYLIDLGTAKILNSKKNHGKTFTMIGTPHYMPLRYILEKVIHF